MNLKKLFPKTTAFLLLAGIFLIIVSFSGCTGAIECSVVVSQSEGVIVKSLEPSYDLIPVGDIISLQAEVQNRGMAEARNLLIRLWSAPGFKILDSDPVKDGINDDIVTTLAPPRLDICSEGDTQTVLWHLQAGCDPRETPLAISVEYDYESNGWASIFIVNGEEAEKTGGKFKEKGQNQPSAGPIQAVIEPLQTEPVILSPSSPFFDVRVKFKNTGDGVVWSQKTGEAEAVTGAIGLVTLNVDGPCRFTELNVGRSPANDKKLYWGTAYRNQVTLMIGTKEALAIAKLEFDGDFSTFVKDFCRINAKVDYHYRSIEDVKKKIGITGSSSQVEECRLGSACTSGCKDEGFDYGRCAATELATGTTIPDICGTGTAPLLICECKNF